MSRFTVSTLLAVALAALPLLGGGCTSKVGAACKKGQVACADGATMLVCAASGSDDAPGIFEAVRCGGPKGCTKGSKIACDGPVARVGGACLGNDASCTESGTEALRCENGKYAPWLACRGPKKCLGAGKTLACDASIARTDEACTKAGIYACADGGKELLQCDGSLWKTFRKCRGVSGCRFDAATSEASCDMSVADAADPCATPGIVACSSDGKAELVCRAGGFAISRACPKKGCRSTDRKRIECE